MAKSTENRLWESGTAKIVKTGISVVLMVYTAIAVILIGNTFLSSFKDKDDLINNTLGFPKSFTLENFRYILIDDSFGKYFLNSIVLSVLSVALLVFLAAMAAYGISKFQFRGSGVIQTYFLIGLMFPIQLGILPLFIMLTKVHLNNTLFGLILLYAANMSFDVYVFSKFFKGVPNSLSESARIDGANEFAIFIQIIMPLSKPVLFTAGLISFVQIWNDFYMPLVFLTKPSVRTLTLAVYTYMSNFLAKWNYVFAAVSMALVPIIIVFFLFSDQIVAGLTGGAVKE